MIGRNADDGGCAFIFPSVTCHFCDPEEKDRDYAKYPTVTDLKNVHRPPSRSDWSGVTLPALPCLTDRIDHRADGNGMFGK